MATGSFFLMLCALVMQAAAAEPKASERWEKDITAFEAQDAKSPPPKNAVLFVGSSSIRLWNLSESFPDFETINRGFGGSEVADSVRYTKRIVIPHSPRIVVLYAGDNDIANGKSPQRVLADFKEFIELVHGALPKTKIVYIGIKPSIKRWALIDKIRQANRLIRNHIDGQKSDRLAFVEVEKSMLGKDGKPREDLLLDDGLHLNKKAYVIWAELVRKEIERD
ncbi:MAG: GDSL-type esterase/lipase family protein [Pirellulales bacterium]